MIDHTHDLISFFSVFGTMIWTTTTKKESRGTNYRTKFFYCYRNATSFEIINHGNVSLTCYKPNEVNVYCYYSNCENKWPKPRPRYNHQSREEKVVWVTWWLVIFHYLFPKRLQDEKY